MIHNGKWFNSDCLQIQERLSNLCQFNPPKRAVAEVQFRFQPHHSPHPLPTYNQRNSYLYSLSVKLVVKTIMSQRWLQIFDNSGPNTMLKCKTKQFEFPGLSDNNGGGEQWHRRHINGVRELSTMTMSILHLKSIMSFHKKTLIDLIII